MKREEGCTCFVKEYSGIVKSGLNKGRPYHVKQRNFKITCPVHNNSRIGKE